MSLDMSTWGRKKMREWMRERRKLRRKLGWCVTCGSAKPARSRVNCKKCLKRAREYQASK